MESLKNLRKALFAGLLLSLVSALSAHAKQQKIYVFGNSLFHHLSDSDVTTVPHWMALLARQQGQLFTLDGEFGFLPNFISKPEPTPGWAFQKVTSGWNSERSRFSRSGIDHIIIVPSNFVQYQPPSAPYDGMSGPRTSPLEATMKLMDTVIKARPHAKFYIYEGWADMAGFGNGFPPKPNDLERYFSYNSGKYHDWYLKYTAELSRDQEVELIPVATVLAKLLTQDPLNQLTPQDLYLDDAPHGTATLYFLAAMITYSSLFEKPLPTSFAAPRSIHPIVANAYSDIAQEIPNLIAESISTIQR